MKFKSDIEVQAGLKDSSGSNGSSGQVLSSNGGTISWINSGGGTASDVQNQVKAGVAINKGQAVYVTSADGTNIIVGLASNTTEATSSKTLGLLNATVAINGFADVVQIGKLEGLDTSTATVGDPVWLGTNGNLIYGLANKPYAPAHLVYIGVVTRVNANNGEIFVTVQNGFELKEIHDVDIITTPPSGGDVLGFEGAPVNLWVNKTIPGWLGYTPVPTTRTLTINGSTQDLSANRTFTIDTGVTSFNTRTGAVTLTSGDVTTALGYTPVTQARTLTINGTTYDLSANRSWTVTTPETDTLATVTARGNVANTSIAVRNSILVNKSDGSSGGQLSYDSSINQLYLWNSVSSGYFSVYTNSAERLNISSGGAVTANVDMRSPIFYDSNNTGYYLDPASTSNLNSVTINSASTVYGGLSIVRSGGASDPYGALSVSAPSSDNYAYMGFTRNGIIGMAMGIDTNNNYWIGTSGGGFSSVRTGTYMTVSSGGNVIATADFRAPVFYDSNDTGYYVNPASTSNLNAVNLQGLLQVAGTSGNYNEGMRLVSGTGSWSNIQFGANMTGVGTQTNQWIVGKRPDGNFVMSLAGNQDGGSRFLIQQDGRVQSPVYYDGNDTGYYLDPNGTSNLSTLITRSSIVNSGGHYSSYIQTELPASNNGAGTGLVTMRTWCSEPNATWDGAGFGYNVYNDGGTPNAFGRANTNFGQAYMRMVSTGNWYFYTTNTSGTRYSNMELTPNGNVWMNNVLEVATSSRAPIFYDLNDTGYYVDPASTSNIRNITVSSLANSTGLTVNHSGSTPAPAAKFNSAGGGTTYGAITATFDSCNYGTAIRVVTGLWSASQGAIQFYSNTTPVGNIQCSTTTTTYSTTSDYRLKENVVAMESSIDRLKALNPCRFNFKNEPTRIVDGFIAHEVQAIIPEAVTGKKDEIDPTGEPVYQGIDQAKIVPLLTAALQEAIEKINNLEQRINILENK